MTKSHASRSEGPVTTMQTPLPPTHVAAVGYIVSVTT